ncbi:hypothetical protein ACIHCV_42900 [Streptomyces sp. NPDC051956]|uniref:hypothetical protein n=1 Tax=Streptomyces sp. NPDC051956 TaxID=3365677 RepID=UPI0037D67FFA
MDPGIIGQAAGQFAVTNIDDILILARERRDDHRLTGQPLPDPLHWPALRHVHL